MNFAQRFWGTDMKNSHFAYFYTKSYALIRESFVLIRGSSALIRETKRLFAKVSRNNAENIYIFFFCTKVRSMGFRMKPYFKLWYIETHHFESSSS